MRFYKKIINNLILFFRKCGKDNIAAFSAQSAFFIIISAFPVALLLMILINPVFSKAEDIIAVVKDLLPLWLYNFIYSYTEEINKLSNNTVISFATIATVVSASKGILAIIFGLDFINREEEKRSFIKVRFTAGVYTLAFIGVIILSLLFLVFSNLLYFLRIIFSFFVLVFFFTIMYSRLPSKKSRFISNLPGALFCSVGWIVFSYFYSIYIESANKFPLVYGSVTGIVCFMIWLYFCMYMLFLGAEINSILK